MAVDRKESQHRYEIEHLLRIVGEKVNPEARLLERLEHNLKMAPLGPVATTSGCSSDCGGSTQYGN